MIDEKVLIEELEEGYEQEVGKLKMISVDKAVQIINQQPTTDGWIPVRLFHRLTKISDDTTHANKVCCTHFMSEECQKVEGNCSAGCFWEEYVWERLECFESYAEQGRLVYLPQPYKESE